MARSLAYVCVGHDQIADNFTGKTLTIMEAEAEARRQIECACTIPSKALADCHVDLARSLVNAIHEARTPPTTPVAANDVVIGEAA